MLTLILLLAFQTLAQTKPHYAGQLRLPFDLFTEEGVLLQTGRFSLELRIEQGQASLLFLRQGKVVATVLAQAPAERKEGSRVTSLGFPILGTVHMAPVGSLNKDDEAGAKSTPAEHFPNLSWKASLRVYRSENPQIPEVNFVFLERDSAGKLLRRDFVLSLKKPQ